MAVVRAAGDAEYMSSMNATEPESTIELTRQPRLNPWFGFVTKTSQDVDSPSSSGRFLFSNDPGWLNPFSRLPATPSSNSAVFEDIPLDAGPGSELISAHPSGSSAAKRPLRKPPPRSASDKLRKALNLPKPRPAER